MFRLARLRINTLKVCRAISIFTLLTIIIVTTFILRKMDITFNSTVNIHRPVTNGTIWILNAECSNERADWLLH